MRLKNSLALVGVIIAAVGLLAAAKLGGWQLNHSAGQSAVASAPVPAAVVPPVDVPILVYHNVRPTPARKLSAADAQYEVTPQEFLAQMTYLKDHGFTPVSFAALGARLAKADAPWPAKPVIVSLDDGRRSQLENAVPILDKLGIKATFFIFTNAPDRNSNYFTWDEIKKLEADGQEIGSHTRLHQYLTKLDDTTLAAELEAPQADFEKYLGHRVQTVSYPFGLVDDRVRAASAQAGYTLGRALHHRVAITAAEKLDLPGYIATGDIKKFQEIMNGAMANR